MIIIDVITLLTFVEGKDASPSYTLIITMATSNNLKIQTKKTFNGKLRLIYIITCF